MQGLPQAFPSRTGMVKADSNLSYLFWSAAIYIASTGIRESVLIKPQEAPEYRYSPRERRQAVLGGKNRNKRVNKQEKKH